MDPRVIVGINVQRLRRERSLTQEELSFRTGMTRAYLSGMEAGRRNATILSLLKIANALETTLEELVRSETAPTKQNKGF